MSQQTSTEKPPTVTQPQIDTMAKVFGRLYRGSGSTLIGIGSDYAILNAVGKLDKAAAHTAIDAFIDKESVKRAEYKASLATQTPATVPEVAN